PRRRRPAARPQARRPARRRRRTPARARRRGELSHHRRRAAAPGAARAGRARRRRRPHRLPPRRRHPARAVLAAQGGPGLRVPLGARGLRRGGAGGDRLRPAGRDDVGARQPRAPSRRPRRRRRRLRAEPGRDRRERRADARRPAKHRRTDVGLGLRLGRRDRARRRGGARVRILYVSAYPPAVDGIGDYTAALAGAVRDDGHAVRVVTARPVAGAPNEVLGGLPRSRRALAELLERIDAWDPDVVHVQFAVAMFGTRLRALVRLMAGLRARRATVVVTLHEVTRDTGSLRAAGRAIYRRVAGLADRVVVHTEQSRAALTGPVGAAVEPVVVAHPRRELPTATASASELRARHGLGAGTVLLSFGFIHVDKGLDDLVDALARLGRRDVRLAVAGTVRRRQGVFRVFELRDRAHLRRVRRLIRRCGLDDRVVFAGYVPEGEVRAWFELAAAAV